MLALTLGQAKTIAVVVVLVLIAGAVISAWLMKQLIQKLMLIVVLAALAVVVWSQRSSLDDCADRVRDAGRTATCSFFGRDVTIDE